ncbi:hypothetical protein MASR2M15_02070 [Anaerolineales bacterium]
MTDPRICNYEDSTYRTDFWEGRGRDYEDQLERRIIQKLLPASGGKRLLELGAGFGRLSQEYKAYETVVLLDYSFSQLQFAREQFGDAGYVYVAADAYRLPFQSGVFDAATMIRVIHHFENVPSVLNGIQRVMVEDADFILEFANKRNVKAMLRHVLGKNGWNPYDREPVEFVELNYDFHPEYIAEELQKAGFETQKRIPVSWLRLAVLKQYIPTSLLVNVDAVLQHSGLLITPSVFTQNKVKKQPINQLDLPNDERLFLCPESQTALKREGDVLISETGVRWAIRDGIYDFKAPL